MGIHAIEGAYLAHPHVLYIDNDFEAKRSAVTQLYAIDIEVLPVSNLREGMSIIRMCKFDLVICDMHLADGNADDLIQALKTSKDYRHIPIVVVATEPNEAEKIQVMKLGAAVHLLKDDPHYGDVIQSTINLHRQDYEETSMGISGQLAKMKIVDLIAHLAAEEGSGIIYIDGGIAMEIHLREGQIIHARHGITIGKKALFRCLRVAEAAFHFVNESKDETSIDTELGALLEEARISNEKLMANYHKLPNANYRVRVVNHEALRQASLKPEARAAIEIIRKYPRIAAYLDRLNLPDIVCYEYLLALLEKGYLELVTEHKPVRVFTDSGADLPEEWLDSMNITALPLKIKVGNDVYSGDKPADEVKLYAKKPKHLEGANVIFPEESEMLDLYKSAVPTHDCLTLLSGTPGLAKHAHQVQQQIFDEGLEGKALLANELTTLDSHAVSLGLGLVVRYAAARAEEGQQIELIEDRVIACLAKIHMIFAVEPDRSTLVKKGNTPVILHWEKDAFREREKLTKGDPPAPVLIREVRKRLDRKANLHIAVGHVRSPRLAETVRNELARQLGITRLLVLPIGPVTGHRLGEGAVGVMFFQE